MESQKNLLPVGVVEPRKAFSPVNIPDNVYEALVEEIYPMDEHYAKFGPALVFRFKITEGTHKDVAVEGICGNKIKEGSKLVLWAGALCGKEFGPLDVVDVNSLVGMNARILVGHQDKTDRDGKSFKQSVVEKVLG